MRDDQLYYTCGHCERDFTWGVKAIDVTETIGKVFCSRKSRNFISLTFYPIGETNVFIRSSRNI